MDQRLRGWAARLVLYGVAMICLAWVVGSTVQPTYYSQPDGAGYVLICYGLGFLLAGGGVLGWLLARLLRWWRTPLS